MGGGAGKTVQTSILVNNGGGGGFREALKKEKAKEMVSRKIRYMSSEL